MSLDSGYPDDQQAAIAHPWINLLAAIIIQAAVDYQRCSPRKLASTTARLFLTEAGLLRYVKEIEHCGSFHRGGAGRAGSVRLLRREAPQRRSAAMERCSSSRSEHRAVDACRRFDGGSCAGERDPR